MSRQRQFRSKMNATTPVASTPLLAKQNGSTNRDGDLLTYDELEDWRKDNHYIHRYYRRTLKSYWACFKSIFSAHNESTNIWTHLIGSLVAIGALVYLIASVSTSEKARTRQGWLAPFAGIPYPFPTADQPSVTWIDSFGFGVFFVSAALCLGFSASFHALTCHSMEVAHRWNNFDYIGIVILISGTFVPAVRYGFFCDPHLRNFYITMIYVAALVTAWTVLAPHARTPEFRRFRAWVFIALGLSAVIPVGHAVIRYGLEGASRGISLQWLALGGALYIVGAVLYAERCPERLAPGNFDLLGSSHQIFHVLILLAALSHWAAISEGFRFWHGEMHGACPAKI